MCQEFVEDDIEKASNLKQSFRYFLEIPDVVVADKRIQSTKTLQWMEAARKAIIREEKTGVTVVMS